MGKKISVFGLKLDKDLGLAIGLVLFFAFLDLGRVSANVLAEQLTGVSLVDFATQQPIISALVFIVFVWVLNELRLR